MKNETMKLINGIEIPKMGFGTWLITGEKAIEAVKDAIEVGYRHIDSAQAYGNEVEVGKAIRECGVPREEIFVTTKLAAEIKDYNIAKEEIQKSLDKLDIGYIDLMLIHCPQPWALYRQTMDRFFQGNLAAWKALEEYYNEGKIKAIGVSNFLQEDIENIMNNATVKPMVNQIECHVFDTPHDLIDYCKSQDIVVEAYSPIAHGRLLNNEVVINMAEKYNVSVAQLCIKYTLQLDTVTLPKATSRGHIEDNFNIDFVISDEDMEILKAL